MPSVTPRKWEVWPIESLNWRGIWVCKFPPCNPVHLIWWFEATSLSSPYQQQALERDGRHLASPRAQFYTSNACAVTHGPAALSSLTRTHTHTHTHTHAHTHRAKTTQMNLRTCHPACTWAHTHAQSLLHIAKLKFDITTSPKRKWHVEWHCRCLWSAGREFTNFWQQLAHTHTHTHLPFLGNSALITYFNAKRFFLKWHIQIFSNLLSHIMNVGMTTELTMKCDCLGCSVVNKFTGSAHPNEEKKKKTFSTFRFCGTLSLQ